MFELDHVFIATPRPEASIAALEGLGLTLGRRGSHAGQGTANAVFFFDNVYLELLWIDDLALASGPDVVVSGLPTRLSWPQARCSPFGISFRHADSAQPQPLPIETWGWHAPFLPPGAVPIPIASGATLMEPLLFVSLVTARPDQWQVPRQETAGLREVTDVRCVVEGVDALSGDLQQMEALGIVSSVIGPAPRLHLTLDSGRRGRSEHLTELPLSLHL